MKKLKKVFLGIVIVAIASTSVYNASKTKLRITNLRLFDIEMSADGANCEVTRDAFHKYGCFGESGTCTFIFVGRTFTCDGKQQRIW